jgi:hypothetical protein
VSAASTPLMSESVAGVDRPHEGVRRLDAADVGDLLHVEQGRRARHDVLARGRGRGQHVAVVPGQLDDQGRHVLGLAVLVVGSLGEQHLGHAGHLRGRLGDRLAAVSGDQDVDLRAAGHLLSRRHRV